MFSAAHLSPMLALITMSLSLYAHAGQIHTGGETGAYHSIFCPLAQKRISQLGQDYSCTVSAGSAANIRRVVQTPSDFGFAQLDAFTLENQSYGIQSPFQIVRLGDVHECIFAVTRRRTLNNFGQIAVQANRLHFVLPPPESGSAQTFKYLQNIDKDGLGRAINIRYETSTDRAVNAALLDDSVVTFFVQFPDPDNERFKMIHERGGHIVPIIDQTLFSVNTDEQNIYFPQETDIRQTNHASQDMPPILEIKTPKLVTACTPMVLFTGTSTRIFPPTKQTIHHAIVTALQNTEKRYFLPNTGRIAEIIDRTKGLPKRVLQELTRASSNARERARPFFERAYRDAQRRIRIMILKAKPQP